MYKLFVKRLLDVVLSLAALVILAVPMMIFAVMIKREDKGSAFFRQKIVSLPKVHRQSEYLCILRGDLLNFYANNT